MRLQQLLEARKKPDRRHIRQKLAYDYRGPVKGEVDPSMFSANAPWQRKVSVIFREMNVPSKDRRRIMDSFNILERTKGRDYMQLLSVAELTAVIHKLVKDYAFEKSRPVAHQRPGVSGSYHSPYGFPSHAKMTPDRALRHATVDDDLHLMSGRDLALHSDPRVRKIAAALHPGSENQAVVYDLDNIPYYILVRPHKKAPGSAPKEGGMTEFVANIPKGILPSDQNFALYHKKQLEIGKLMKTNAGMEVLASKKSKDFQSTIVHFQQLAWQKCKKWFEAYTYYHQAKKIRDDLELKDQREHGLDYEGELALKKAHVAVDFYHDIMLGKVPKGHFPDQEVYNHIKSVAREARSAYKWYVWLLVSEAEYGIRLPERARLYPNFPTTPSATKGLPYHWSIQPKRNDSGEFKWNPDVIKGLGYTVNAWENFISDLKASKYKFTRGDGEIQQIWLPIVGKVREKFGLKLHPQNISDYIASANRSGKVEDTAKYVAGKTGNRLNVVKAMRAPLYISHGGTQNREFALIPAANYHQYFDSPYHGGERLIHGEAKLQPPVSKLTLSKGRKWGDRTKNLAQSYRAVRGVSRGFERRVDKFSYRDPEQERLVRDAAMAAQNIRFAREALKKKDARSKRIAARQNDPTHTWQAPKKVLREPGHKKGMWVATKNKGRKRYKVVSVSDKEQDQRMWRFGKFTTNKAPGPDEPRVQRGAFKTKRRSLRGSDLDLYTFPHKQSRT